MNRLESHHDATDKIASQFFDNASAMRINTDAFIYNAIKSSHPKVTVIDTDTNNCNIISYISATGNGTLARLTNSDNTELFTTSQSSWPSSLYWTTYLPPARRLDGGPGTLVHQPIFDKFLVTWKNHEFLVYVADCRDGTNFIRLSRQYVLTSNPNAAYSLLKIVGAWQNILHNEVWVFDQGYWHKDPQLFASIQKSRWTDIILPEDLKEDLLDTVLRFYGSKETYARLRVPWKRGLIFYGPPGNGKTISIKATMKTLFDREESIPTLYVKSLQSPRGPEYSVSSIFDKARAQAPCYLVFEDLDSMVTDKVRSFFLNAVDGLSENEGILMVGSTNHIERLDPGLAKRPSRFDRKYLFDDPDLEQRTKYCQYWQRKLEDNKDVEFPDKLCPAIAGLMGGFSFAYMQEAFVSALLKIATEQNQAEEEESEWNKKSREGEKMPNEATKVKEGRKDQKVEGEEAWDLVKMEEEIGFVGKDKAVSADDDRGGSDDDFDRYVLWREIKVQIKNLKKELGKGENSV